MLFNSIEFLLFFPIVCVLYFLLPHRFRYLLLLFAGYVFYAFADPHAVVFLVLTTVITWVGGNLLYNGKKTGFAGLILSIGLLAYLKYVPYLFSLFRNGGISVILPVGISFYTFQSVTYLLDCYRKECESEKNFLKYALFVSFFPTILSGPIQRAKTLLKQFDEEHDFDTVRAKEGLCLMLWGYFLKMVISSRLSLLTDLVFGSETMAGLPVLLAIFAYSFQIYCDFAGYSFIATGCAKIMGFTLPANFRQPYLAVSVADFWRRWHISLSSWFRDYLYIPLGGNRKGTVRKYLNVMIVFLVSGIWHGANVTYLFWGFLHGIYQVTGGCLSSLFHKDQTVQHASGMQKVLRIAGTFLLITFSWVFFRAPSISEAFLILKRLFTGPYLGAIKDGTLFSLGLGVNNLVFVCAALLLLIVTDLLCEKRQCDVSHLLTDVKWPVRWLAYYCIVTMILFSCNLSTQEFLYMQF
ncbi:MAG: MBOAT family protein [Lachnospiraceae bacterium]|nr:MBOAT family protein [Lachnospiraceae bacterium]